MRYKKSVQPASLDQTRDRLMTQRLALKNKAGNILNACGVDLTEEALSSEEKLVEVLELPRNEIVRRQLRVIVEHILNLESRSVDLESRIGETRGVAGRYSNHAKAL
jgi:hypothetical protein